MEINIICVGKIKEKFYRDAIEAYSKEIGKYFSLKIIEIIDEKTPEKASEKEELQIKNKEGESILRYIKENSYVIALDIKGQKLSSKALAEKIKKVGTDEKGSITFLIGGSLGLAQKVLSRADEKISFSKMTFPHQLFRVMILEQVYRIAKINQGEI